MPFFCISQWDLVWSDEFNSNTLNQSNWVYESGTGQSGWGNNELQYYTARAQNVFVDTGYLHIVARAESYQGASYTSARIKTQGKFDVKYGKIESRLKVPVDQGLWPAFWMLGSNITSKGWPACGEIDIMEHVNNELKIHGTMHFDMWGHTYSTEFVYADASIFHVYAIEWDSNGIKWFLDGQEYHSESIGSGTVSREEFHAPFFLLLNLAVGGNWPGSPNGTTDFPATYFVDYVRVYQKGASLEEEKLIEVKIFPNPTTDKVIIESETSFSSFNLSDLSGKSLISGAFQSEINLSSLKSGSYQLVLTTTSGERVHRNIVVQ